MKFPYQSAHHSRGLFWKRLAAPDGASGVCPGSNLGNGSEFSDRVFGGPLSVVWSRSLFKVAIGTQKLRCRRDSQLGDPTATFVAVNWGRQCSTTVQDFLTG
ncbi:hypothetical protein PAPYR_7451 [Paratrimastix pyriformis]|uniref:Uncharacterized protein n=1 Tax=Paratrimastix pyriformis TaxID=342808 RepID=A0ABQ8UHH9_9EUKA|nr:hypothetical protein PAPYR_7451 [Paratrimastix pyriformis]